MVFERVDRFNAEIAGAQAENRTPVLPDDVRATAKP